jgi:DNA-binding response OmpR family regulator
VDVAILRWPLEEDRRQTLVARGLPRVLLVDDEHEAPVVIDVIEDWIRMPASQDDIDLRCRTVATRAAAQKTVEPELDADGVLRCGSDWVSLPPVEARLMTALLDRFGAVVSRDQLARAGWPKGAPGRNALDVHMLRLRRRIDPVGLVIRTVRSRGYLLEADQGQIGVSA